MLLQLYHLQSFNLTSAKQGHRRRPVVWLLHWKTFEPSIHQSSSGKCAKVVATVVFLPLLFSSPKAPPSIFCNQIESTLCPLDKMWKQSIDLRMMMRFCMGLLCNPVGLVLLLIPPPQNKRSVTHEKSAMCYSVVDALPRGWEKSILGVSLFFLDTIDMCAMMRITYVMMIP